MRAITIHLAVGLLAALLFAPAAPAAVSMRLKDISRIREVRSNQLYGLGLVVGLNGTGDDEKLASQLVGNLLDRMRISIPRNDLTTKNVAVVMVTADIPAFMAEGSKLDVLVSAIGAATSLEGGTLLQAPLQGADGAVYAVAQGPLSTGSFTAGGEAAKIRKNHPTVGRVPGGALVEKRIGCIIRPTDDLNLVLNTPDFTTAVRTAEVVSKVFNGAARPINAALIQVAVPTEYRTPERLPLFIAQLQELRVTPDSPARIVVNERTGTIVAGENVRLSAAAISHGNLTIAIRETTQTSQPNPFSEGKTRTEKSTEVVASEPVPGIVLFEDAATLAEVARALNLLGVTPRDMVAIFQALREAGALQCELLII